VGVVGLWGGVVGNVWVGGWVWGGGGGCTPAAAAIAAWYRLLPECGAA